MKPATYALCALGVVMAAGCGEQAASQAPPETPASAAESPPEAATPEQPSVASEEPVKKAAEPSVIEVTLEAKSGSKLTGTAKFSEEGDGVKVVIQLANLTPGLRASHIHEKGDCSAPDAASAGSHFNPDNHPHARPPDEPRHLGDLGNIPITPIGTGSLEIVVKGANLKPGDPHSFLDRAIIIHEKKDDGAQPTGNAGGRIGCGVIKAK